MSTSLKWVPFTISCSKEDCQSRLHYMTDDYPEAVEHLLTRDEDEDDNEIGGEG